MTAFQFYLQLGKQRKVGRVGGDSHVVFVISHPPTASQSTANSFVAKIRGEVSAHFHEIPENITVECGIDCFACQNEFFTNNTLDVKEK
jgi:GGDEF domain-containing protein